jgi:Ethanolamine utilization protein EutJ (predicted chaperonin)
MMKKTTSFRPILAAGLLFLLALTVTGCKKDTQCDAIITVLDTNGVPVAGALIKLTAVGQNGPGDVVDQQNTDASGQTRHSFKLPAIFNIEATTTTPPRTNNNADVIRLEIGESVTKEVTIQ